MNYLQLCQSLRQEASDAGSGPSTVVSQTGEHGRYVKWIKDYWVSLQQERDDFLWMRKSFTVSTVASDGAYAYADCTDTVTALAIARFAKWYKKSFKCYLTSDGVATEYPLIWTEWEDFRRIYRYGPQTDNKPIHVSVDPTQAFVLGPKPDGIYSVSGDYQIGPQIMTADADVPEMPTRFHDLIWMGALAKYGGSRVAVEAMVRARAESRKLKFALERDQLPPLTYGRPLA